MKSLHVLVLALLPLAFAGLLRAQDEDPPKQDPGMQDPPKQEPPKADDPTKPEGPPKQEPPKPEDPPKQGPAKPDPKKPDLKKDDDAQQKLLAKKIHVPFTYDSETSTFDASYSFSERGQKKDWSFSNLQRSVVGNEAQETAAHMELAVGSDSGFALLDPVEFISDFTIETTVKVLFRATSSQLAFVFGSKQGSAFGLKWGDETIKILRAGLQHLSKGESSAEQEYSKERVVTIKIERSGDKITSWVQGEEKGTRAYKRKELDGKIGFWLDNTLKLEVQRLHVKGVIGKVKP